MAMYGIPIIHCGCAEEVQSTKCVVKMLHQHFYLPLTFHTKNLLVFQRLTLRLFEQNQVHCEQQSKSDC